MNFEQMTPEELEKPVNGYQMLAVVKELQGLNSTLTVVAEQTKGVITPAQLMKSEADMKEYTDKKIDEEVTKIHLEYRPIKNGLTWFTKTLIGAVIAQVITLAGTVYLLINSK